MNEVYENDLNNCLRFFFYKLWFSSHKSQVPEFYHSGNSIPSWKWIIWRCEWVIIFRRYVTLKGNENNDREDSILKIKFICAYKCMGFSTLNHKWVTIKYYVIYGLQVIRINTRLKKASGKYIAIRIIYLWMGIWI